MPVNAGYEFAEAEKKFVEAKTDEEKIEALRGMLSTCPDHKGAENIRANIKTRIKKLEDKVEKDRAKRKGSKNAFSVKKGDMQAVLVGLTNAGKSSLMQVLTNINPKIASYGFTTQVPEVGMLYHATCPIQIVDLPAIGSEGFETGIINTADTALLVIERIAELLEIEKVLKKFNGKRIVVFNKIDLHDVLAKRKISETLKTKRHNFSLVSCRTGEGIEDLKEKIFKSFDKIRVYTKQPKKADEDKDPIIMKPNSTLGDIAKIIFKGNMGVVKRARLWGPSSKFGGQQVGLKHQLKDKDIVEFSTR